MPYGYSDQERGNLKWFANDSTRQSLKAIHIMRGQIRGLRGLRIEFNYPISVIAGKNGSGKSSILALAACAFHNKNSGWRLPERKISYYTYSDFFIQTAEDVPIDGIWIRYGIHHDKWKPTESLPSGVGIGYQIRKKNKGGKWNDYDKRVPRCVAFLGIERVVPPAERSVYKSYRYSFSSSAKAGWEERVCKSVSRVLGVSYDDFEIKSYGKYRLPLVKRKEGRYSGFNMGAGEKALFEVFATILAAPDGALFLIDELELGLHESAQRRLVKELGELCLEKKIQIICTTHSPVILSSLPPEGRFLTQSGKVTQILKGVSPAYAAGRLGEVNSGELTIFVEDDVASTLIEESLDHSTRQRIQIIPIGSHSAVVHQMAARYLEGARDGCLAILDGDQASMYGTHVKKFCGYIGGKTDKIEGWIGNRLLLLPDGLSPENWVFKKLNELSDEELSSGFGIKDTQAIRDALESAILAEDHSQIYVFCGALGLNEKYVWRDCCRVLMNHGSAWMDVVTTAIRESLIT